MTIRKNDVITMAAVEVCVYMHVRTCKAGLINSTDNDGAE